MKYSKYNSRIAFSEHTDILFNAFTAEFCCIRKDSIMDLDRLGKNDISEFKEKGIIVEDDDNEDEKVWSIYAKSTCEDDYFRLTINPTLNCNFRCWYCSEDHYSNAVMSDEMIEKVKDVINSITDRFSMIELAFFGGEPFLEYERVVLPLMQYMKDQCAKKHKEYVVTFTTNGFLLNNSIIKSLKNFNVGTSQITLDGNRGCHNKTRVSCKADSYQTIISNIRKLLVANLQVLLRINVTHDNIEGAMDIPETFSSLKYEEKQLIRVIVQQVWQDHDYELLNEKLELYQKFLEVGILPWPRRFNHISDICYADKLNSAIINYNGKVYKCTAMNFDKTPHETSISDKGNYVDEEKFLNRLRSRKNNILCKACRIRPICNGGCFKNISMNNKDTYCIHPSDKEKDKFVMDIIKEELFIKKNNIPNI